MKLLKSLLLFILISWILTSCVQRPDSVIAPDDMVELLVDIHKTEGILDVQSLQFKDDDSRKALMASVYVRHGVSKSIYDSSLVWYSQNLKQFIRVYERVQERLALESELLSEREQQLNYISVSENGDSLDVWPFQHRYTSLDLTSFNSVYRFEIPTDSNYWAGDSLAWQFVVSALPSHCYGIATLSMLYDDESLQTICQVFRSDTLAIVSLRERINLNPKLVMGSFVLLSDKPSEICTPTFIYDQHLYRYHP